MGAVYKAIDPRIGRTVAIKVIKADFAQDPELRRRFDTEAIAVGNLQHPNIVVVYEFGEEYGSPYLVMQYLDGTPLDKIIAQRQNLPVIQKLEIIIEVLNALHYAHQNGIIHRDVKPANVLLLKDGHVKLLDFGIARQGNLNQTKTGQMLGTMTYMQTGYWRDSETLWTRALAVTKDNFTAHSNLANTLAAKGRIDEAILHAIHILLLESVCRSRRRKRGIHVVLPGGLKAGLDGGERGLV